MMHQSEFDAANVALSRAADKRKSLINIHKNWYTATLIGACAYISIARKYALIREMRLITSTLRQSKH